MTKQITRIFVFITAYTLLAGCASTQTAPAPAAAPTKPPQAQVLSWPQRYAQLNTIESWNILGSTSIRHQNKTDMASVTWVQEQSSRYSIALYGPLSLGKVTIIGQPNKVTLQQSGHAPVSAQNAEALMQKQLGWQMPVSNLYYWVRGLAAPGATADFKFDKDNHIVEMAQNGWLIQYPSFTQVNNIDVPQRVILTNPNLNLQITLAIRQWIVQPPMQVAVKK